MLQFWIIQVTNPKKNPQNQTKTEHLKNQTPTTWKEIWTIRDHEISEGFLCICL